MTQPPTAPPPVANTEDPPGKETDDSAQLVFVLAVAAAVCGGAGMIASAFPALSVLAVILAVSGIVTGAVGAFLGVARRRRGPAGVSGAAAVFCLIMLGLILLEVTGGVIDGDDDELGHLIRQPVAAGTRVA